MLASKANSVEFGKRVRIGLISPYTGGNLGDAAIIEAARAHLERHFPGVELVLIVLDCNQVSNLHGLGSHPLTAVARPFYLSLASDKAPSGAEGTRPSAITGRSLWYRIRPLMKRGAELIPFALPVTRRFRGGLDAISREVRHFLQGRRLVKSLDGLFVAGGGQFDDEYGGPWGHPYAMFKWINLAGRAGVPVYFAGVGVCEVRFLLTRYFLRRALARARRVSLRDSGSLHILRGLGVHRELELCPDLAFGLPVKSGDGGWRVGTSLKRQAVIGLSPIVFSRPGGWPTAKPALFDRYWLEFTNLAISLLEANYTLKLFVTDYADQVLVKALRDRLGGIVRDKSRLQILPLLRLQELWTLLRSCDVVIASRLHGVLLSHLNSVPVLGISYHRKVRTHMIDLGQERFCIDFETFTAPEARQLLNELLAHRTVIVPELRRLCIDKCKAVEKEFAAIGNELSLRIRGSQR